MVFRNCWIKQDNKKILIKSVFLKQLIDYFFKCHISPLAGRFIIKLVKFKICLAKLLSCNIPCFQWITKLYKFKFINYNIHCFSIWSFFSYWLSIFLYIDVEYRLQKPYGIQKDDAKVHKKRKERQGMLQLIMKIQNNKKLLDHKVWKGLRVCYIESLRNNFTFCYHIDEEFVSR